VAVFVAARYRSMQFALTIAAGGGIVTSTVGATARGAGGRQ
jgi:hypothetical protein